MNVRFKLDDRIKRKIKLLLFIAYTFLLLYITLLGRHHYDPLSAVWSGWIIKKNGNRWNFDALGNILMFIPWTLSMGFAFPRFMRYNSVKESGDEGGKPSRLNKTVKRALLVSFCFSAFIECTQLVLSCGTFQIADLVYNTVSGGIGGWVYVWVRRNIKFEKNGNVEGKETMDTKSQENNGNTEDIFTNDIFEILEPPSGGTVQLVGTSLPNNQDIFFVSKWHEVFNRYCSARLFLRKATENPEEYWFNKTDDPNAQEYFELWIKSELFETALLNYNILVDLTWSWLYVSAEYVLYTFDKDGNIVDSSDVQGMHPIEEAYELLRKTENGVSTPHAEGNPFQYLKVMAPEFSEAVDTLVEFWKQFSNSDIRSLYNYIKHKGKPVYREMDDLTPGKTFGIYIGKESYPSDIRDVQRYISVNEWVEKLIRFDNDILFPYVKRLTEQLKKAVDPSPLAYF